MKNKKLFVLLSIFAIVLTIFISSGKPKEIAAIYFCKEGNKYQTNGQIDQAEKKYLEALKMDPDYISAQFYLYDLYKKEFFNYMDAKNYQQAITYGEKALSYITSNAILFDLGICYKKIQNYPKAAEYFEKVVVANPKDTEAQQALEDVNEQIKNVHLNFEINNMVAIEKAPSELYSLIKTDLGAGVISQVQTIFDLIWSVPTGKVLLQALWKTKIPVYIIISDGTAFMQPACNKKICYVEKITIPLKYIEYMNDKNSNPRLRIYYFSSFMHEFGHAYYLINNPVANISDSLEEEMGVSIIGQNIAYRIISGQPLNEQQIKRISLEYLRNMLSQDVYRKLPVYSGFNQNMANFGISLPYLYIYSDIPELYKQLLSEGKTSHVPNLDKLIK